MMSPEPSASAPDRGEIRVLFLTRYPVKGASSRYRVYQYLPHLEALGVRCRVQSFMDDPMYALSMKPGHTPAKAWATIKAIVRRVNGLRRHRDFDIVYMQRELLPFGPPLLERWLKRRGALLFFDYDDALFIPKTNRFSPLLRWLKSPGRVLEILRLSDHVVAGNDWLRDAARAQGTAATTLEVAEDTARIRMRHPGPEDGVTVGWLGSPSTVKYLRLIAPVLQRIAAEFPHLRFEIMGGGAFAMPGVPWQVSPWSLEGELEALSRFDIGLMPLPDEEWSKGKSGGKARTYMAAGVVPVCTAIGYNLTLIRDGETGFLCRDDESWYRTLSRLIADPALRREVGAAARREIATRYSPRQKAAEMQGLFRAALAARAPR